MRVTSWPPLTGHLFGQALTECSSGCAALAHGELVTTARRVGDAPPSGARSERPPPRSLSRGRLGAARPTPRPRSRSSRRRLGGIALQDAAADLPSVLNGGRGQLVHQPLPSVALAYDEAGDRPDAHKLSPAASTTSSGSTLGGNLPAARPRPIRLARRRGTRSGRTWVHRFRSRSLQQSGVSLLLRGVPRDPAWALQRLAAALACATSVENRLDVLCRCLVGRSPGELGHTATYPDRRSGTRVHATGRTGAAADDSIDSELALPIDHLLLGAP